MSRTPNPFHTTTAHVEQMRQEAIYVDGVFPARTKALAALLWSIAVRCEPCVVHYARKVVELGASKEEMTEMLAVASTMGGCVGETWALKAFAATRQVPAGGSDDAGCCTQA